ncbi:MAG: hypothetical protein ACFE0R_17375 [Salinarimonas sp.]
MPNPVDRIDLLVLGTVNASLKRQISADELSRCLRSADPEPWLVHVATFFGEVSPGLVVDFARAHDVDRRRLSRAYAATKARTGIVNAELEARLDTLAHAS